jgi:hypothetical protein
VLAAVEHKLPPDRTRQVQASGAVAIGTALKVLGSDAGGVDLRQDELRFARTFDQVKTALAVGATLLFFATFLGLLIQVLEKKKVDREFDELREVVEVEIESEVFDEYTKAVSDATEVQLSEERKRYLTTVEAGIKKIRTKLKDELGLATEVPPIRSCLKTWGTVVKSIESVRKQIEYLAIKSEKYDQDKAVLTFAVGAYNDIDALTTQLRANKDVVAGVNPRPPKNVDDRIEIVIELTLVPPTWESESSGTGAAGAAGAVDTADGSAK